MPRIHVMPDTLASQVAAGEVVERPASVVKELVENSLDAAAKRIEVRVRRGGISLIKVVDDGVGMGREDAVLCLQRHATSKIRSKEDLGAIITLGFRGEALPSIASVSHFTLRTREQDALTGTQVTVEGGKLLGVQDCGEAPGTQIEVRNLFQNVPARRKFLRAESTEFSHIEQHLRVQALAHPEVSFTLVHDERIVFQLPGGARLLERIRELCGVELTERLLEVPAQKSAGIRLHGYIGEAGLGRSNRSLCLTFLNGRPVDSPVFSHAFRAAYGEALPRGQHPVAFLFIEIDPSEVDVNVHPAKREVRFRDGMGVQAALTVVLGEIIRRGKRPAAVAAESVAQSPEIPRDVRRDVPKPAPTALPKAQWQAPVRQTELIPTAEQRALRQDWAEWDAHPVNGGGKGGVEAGSTSVAEHIRPAPKASALQPESPSQAEPKPLPYRIIGTLADEYVLMESEEGLVLLDWRAAWERVLFEEAREKAARETTVVQPLLLPITLTLAPREFDFIRQQLAMLRRLGIGAEEFGPNTLKIDALPAIFPEQTRPEDLIHALVDDLAQAGERAAGKRLDLETIAASISRQAAQFRPPQSLADQIQLAERLLCCAMPYCCPAGRATLIQISRQELARKFGKR